MPLDPLSSVALAVTVCAAVPILLGLRWRGSRVRWAAFMAVGLVSAVVLGCVAFFWSGLPLSGSGIAGGGGTARTGLDLWATLSRRYYSAIAAAAIAQLLLSWFTRAALTKVGRSVQGG